MSIKPSNKAIRRPRTTPPKPRESTIQTAVISALLLRWPRALIWRNQSMGIPTKNGGFRPQAALGAAKGSCDIMMLLDGVFFALEIKRDAKSKPTDRQIEFIDHVTRMGGHARVVWDWKDAINFVEDALKAI